MARRHGNTERKSSTAKNAGKRGVPKERGLRGTVQRREGPTSGKSSVSKTKQVESRVERTPGPSAAPRRTVAFEDLTEDQALAILKDAQAVSEQVEQIFQNHSLMKSRKVRMAAVCHPKAPRRLWLGALRQLFPFDLVNVSLMPTAPTDVKRTAEEVLIAKLEGIPTGVRLSLARRGSGRIAATLLMDREQRIVDVALENPGLTEAMVAKTVAHRDISEHAVSKVCRHPKWSVRRDVRVALLRSAHTPLARALEFARGIPKSVLEAILHGSRLPRNVKECLLASSS